MDRDKSDVFDLNSYLHYANQKMDEALCFVKNMDKSTIKSKDFWAAYTDLIKASGYLTNAYNLINDVLSKWE